MNSLNVSNDKILELAKKYGINLVSDFNINEIGLDFQVVMGRDHSGLEWVLRIPRRSDMIAKINYEQKSLEFIKKRLLVPVPDWQIVNSELIAYPMLSGKPGLTFDPITYEVSWNMNQNSTEYPKSLAQVLVSLHSISIEEAKASGIKTQSPDQYRLKMSEDLIRVQQEIGVGEELKTKLNQWINEDSLWPDFSVLVHGDLYVGHTLVDGNANITGVIDWSEVEVSDPAIDFAGHLNVFGEEGLRRLLAEYEKLGGRTWPRIFEHIQGRSLAAPIRYGLFAIETKSEMHLAQARVQLGLK